MNLKKMWKRFWNLNVHNHEGFTLVELIIVIAILAILSSVAVVGYSSYVKKANMQADRTLVAEIQNALSLYYYSNTENVVEGYIVLDVNGEATFKGNFVDEAMKAAYGSDWEKTLKLKYNGWTDNGLLQLLKGYSEGQIDTILSSSFLEDHNAEGVMNAVNNVVGYAADAIANAAGANIDAHLENLGIDCGDLLDGLNDEQKSVVISNLLVGHFANTIDKNKDQEIDPNDPMAGLVDLMYAYANAYAFSTAPGGNDSILRALEAQMNHIVDPTNPEDDEMEELGKLGSQWDKYVDEDDLDKFDAWDEATNGQGFKNKKALDQMMGAVSSVAGDYKNQEDLLNKDLFASESVVNQLDIYMKAVKALKSGMELPAMQPGQVAVIVFSDGTVYVTINTVG